MSMGLVLGITLKFYTSVAKRLKLRVIIFWSLIFTFVEVTEENLVGWPFCPPPLLFLKSIKATDDEANKGHAPLKKRLFVRVNQAPFMNKKINK